MKNALPYLASLLFLAPACGDGATGMAATPDGGTINATTGKDATPPGPPTLAGVYECQGVWDLSGPITANRTLGDVAADLLVEEIVERAGVPSQLRGQAEDAVRSAIAGKVKALIDSNGPAALRPDSELMKKLSVVLASTEVRSTIDLTGAATSVRGTEALRAFTFTHQGAKKTLTVDQLLGTAAPLVTLAADWKGKEAGPGTLEIEAHDFELRLGKLVLLVVQEVLVEVGAGGLADAAAAVIDCQAIPAAVLDGKDKLTFGVGAVSYSVGPDVVTGGCGKVAGLVKERALGLFDIDAGVRVGGRVSYREETGDARVDRLTSQAGYGGLITRGIRPALAPRVTARFEAVRKN
jgi:hypothetical protein